MTLSLLSNSISNPADMENKLICGDLKYIFCQFLKFLKLAYIVPWERPYSQEQANYMCNFSRQGSKNHSNLSRKQEESLSNKIFLPLPPPQDQTSSLENSPTQFIQATEWYKVSPVVWKEWKEKERERGHRFKSLNWHF